MHQNTSRKSSLIVPFAIIIMAHHVRLVVIHITLIVFFFAFCFELAQEKSTLTDLFDNHRLQFFVWIV